MDFTAIDTLITQAQQIAISDEQVKQAVKWLDLTNLDDHSQESDITTLCRHAQTPMGNVAAVCLYGKFVGLAKKLLAQQPIQIATVANFPSGNKDIDSVLAEIKQQVSDGADEIDVVIPYQRYLQQGITPSVRQEIVSFVHACQQACQGKLLKVIIESGELQRPEYIAIASEDAIAGGADFIKTSTGKVGLNATLPAAAIMLTTIKNSGKDVGFKAAGGIKTVESLKAYLALTQQIMGADWITPRHFRIGASSLLDALLRA